MAGDDADGKEDEASDHHGDGVHLRMSEHGRHEHDRECERSDGDAASLTELERHEHDRHDGEEREPEGRVIREDHGREHGDEEDRRAAEQQRAPLRPATHQEAERSGCGVDRRHRSAKAKRHAASVIRDRPWSSAADYGAGSREASAGVGPA